MGLAERNKGARGELEVLHLIQARWPHATRNFASGAAGNLDIANGPADALIEVKRTERLRIREAWYATELAAMHARKLPVIAHRWSATRSRPAAWLAITELEEFLTLLHFKETA
jgi:hypothetical protein